MGDLDFMVSEIQSTFSSPLVAIPDSGAKTCTQFQKSSRRNQNYFKKCFSCLFLNQLIKNAEQLNIPVGYNCPANGETVGE